jgi:hypothetical protein
VSREEPWNCLIDAVSTTGKLATVRDMQSSTSAEMMTGMPPRVMIYAAWTRDTMVVTTGKRRSERRLRGKKIIRNELEVEKMKMRSLR